MRTCKCRYCNGEGWVWSSASPNANKEDCPLCFGTGKYVLKEDK